MRENYLGDSYDLVKRFWGESLRPIAPLYAHSRFVPAKIRARYTAVTSIPILESPPQGHFGILLDPHTGDLKREFLRKMGIEAFYYVSHAPFLFLASDVKIIRAIRTRLVELGIPEKRLEPGDF